ncbi:MAG: DUF1446 domain-containing protein [Neisseriaceae bacterium]|nr:DUF1446 domain-containing protein [Neisseriaceae bacterium]MBP6861575.1 DUF1446 domain-containing protein [Neisseriaceae bacterium]
MKTIRIGAGAGYAGDRIEPALELAQKGDLDYLVFECLAERTIALGQKQKARDPNLGYNELLAARMRAVLPVCGPKRIRIVTNMGAANPAAAAQVVAAVAQELGLNGLTIAVVEGDDVHTIAAAENVYLETQKQYFQALSARIISANAYTGAEGLMMALAAGADVVIAGRVADPSLFLAIMRHEFGWAADDWVRLGKGTLVGHLLECAGQVSGGYYAQPGINDVPNLAHLGFPLAEVNAAGDAVITKVAGSGGCVTVATCTAQLLYEIHDPERYLTPDVTADFSQVTFTQIGPDRVAVAGASGRPRPPLLKVSVAYADGFIGSGEIAYAGVGALERAQLALSIVQARFDIIGLTPLAARYDLIGVNALHGDAIANVGVPYEVRARVAARCAAAAEAAWVGNEVEALYTNGPAGGGGVMKQVSEVVAIDSAYLPRALVVPRVHCVEVIA